MNLKVYFSCPLADACFNFFSENKCVLILSRHSSQLTSQSLFTVDPSTKTSKTRVKWIFLKTVWWREMFSFVSPLSVLCRWSSIVFQSLVLSSISERISSCFSDISNRPPTHPIKTEPLFLLQISLSWLKVTSWLPAGVWKRPVSFQMTFENIACQATICSCEARGGLETLLGDECYESFVIVIVVIEQVRKKQLFYFGWEI